MNNAITMKFGKVSYTVDAQFEKLGWFVKSWIVKHPDSVYVKIGKQIRCFENKVAVHSVERYYVDQEKKSVVYEETLAISCGRELIGFIRQPQTTQKYSGEKYILDQVSTYDIAKGKKVSAPVQFEPEMKYDRNREYVEDNAIFDTEKGCILDLGAYKTGEGQILLLDYISGKSDKFTLTIKDFANNSLITKTINGNGKELDTPTR